MYYEHQLTSVLMWIPHRGFCGTHGLVGVCVMHSTSGCHVDYAYRESFRQRRANPRSVQDKALRFRLIGSGWFSFTRTESQAYWFRPVQYFSSLHAMYFEPPIRRQDAVDIEFTSAFMDQFIYVKSGLGRLFYQAYSIYYETEKKLVDYILFCYLQY